MLPSGEIAPAIAERIEVSPDRTLYTFYLRQSVWSNGDPLTAYDFERSFLSLLSPSFPCANTHLLYGIKNAEKAKNGEVPLSSVGIRATDTYELEIELEQPNPAFLGIISFCIFLPVHPSQDTTNWTEENFSSLLCNGPYRLISWKVNNELVLEKNPYYWEAEQVVLEKMVISIITNEMTAMKLFDNQELDLIGSPFTSIPSVAISSLIQRGLLRTAPFPAATICAFNMQSPPFTNLHIRKAFALAINRKELVDNITLYGEEIGPRLIPRSLMPIDLPLPYKDADYEGAREHLLKGLEELKMSKEELSIKFLHANTGIYPKIAEALQHQWKKVLDVWVELESYEYKIFLSKLAKRDFQLAECIWIAQYPDPMNFFERFLSPLNTKNYPSFSNASYNALVEHSLYKTHREERFQTLGKAEQILHEEMPLTTLYHWNNVYIQQPYVHGLLTYPTGGFYLSEIALQEADH